MLDAIEQIIPLLTDAVKGVFIDNEIGSLWVALIVVMVVFVFILGKLTNRNN